MVIKVYVVQIENEQNSQMGGDSIDKQSYMYQLTINNPIEKGYTHDKIKQIVVESFKTNIYMCMADEIGSTFHTHVFLVFSSRVRWSMIKGTFQKLILSIVKEMYLKTFYTSKRGCVAFK